MKISLNEIIEGQKLYLDLNVDVKLNVNDLGDEISVISPVSFLGKIINQSGKILLIGKYSCDIEFICHRCLDHFTRKVQGNIEERLVLDDSEESETEDFYSINNSKIDLREIIEDSLILSLPIKVICDDNCKGLCPICGANLNSDQCTCTEDKIDPRLAKLKELLQND